MHARFDKDGRRLPDTGHGCGCRMCQDAGEPRYERRLAATPREERAWSPLRRKMARLARSVRFSMRRRRPQTAE